MLQRGVFVVAALMLSILAARADSPADAICVLQTTDIGKAYDIQGTVHFTFDPKDTLAKIAASISGNAKFAAKSLYAMHVHTFGDLSATADGLSAGPHYVPLGGWPDHGCPPNNRHNGDMGNWTQSGGRIDERKELDLLQLFGPASIIGRTVVLHENFDNCNGTTGDSGARLAFCVIGLANSEGNFAFSGADERGSPQGICVFQPTTHCKGSCSGTAYLSMMNDTGIINVKAKVNGLQGSHAFHLHWWGDLRASDGSELGNDWNPWGRDHNVPIPGQRKHMGDLGNIATYDSTGTGWYDFPGAIGTGLDEVIGRAMAIYSGKDHGNGAGCNWEGSSGDIIMMCVIGFKNPSTPVPAVPSDVKINNDWKSESCTQKSSDDDNDNSDLVAGLVVGWLFFGALLAAVIAMVLFLYFRRRRSAAEELGLTYGPRDDI